MVLEVQASNKRRMGRPANHRTNMSGADSRLRIVQSMLALFLGFVVVVALSLSVDEVLHLLRIYPPWGEPMVETSDNLLALSYRCVIGVLGSYVTARFAPYAPMKHVWVGAAIGVVLGTLGTVVGTGAPLARSAADISVEAIGRALFGPLIVPFELTAPLLLVAVVGAVVIWRRQERRKSAGSRRTATASTASPSSSPSRP